VLLTDCLGELRLARLAAAAAPDGGISLVGFATVATNLWFLYKPNPRPVDRIKEHIKSLVGAGHLGLHGVLCLRRRALLPEIALTPALWSVP
jgi:hypothetical protein